MQHEIIRYSELPSTHACAMDEGASLADGAVVVADVQTDGRGRRGRRWTSPAGEGLLFSIVLKPRIPASEAPLVTILLAAAIARALEPLGIAARIRWPNDVVVGKTKIAGILAEARLAEDGVLFVVASAGVNVNQDAAALAAIDRPATSLRAERGGRYDPASLLTPILASFDDLYGLLLTEGPGAAAPRWRPIMALAGETIALDFGSRIVQGRVRGFGDDGSIEIEEAPGAVSRHVSGEVVRLVSPGERMPG